jgi:hypothetical protein
VVPTEVETSRRGENVVASTGTEATHVEVMNDAMGDSELSVRNEAVTDELNAVLASVERGPGEIGLSDERGQKM